jgi:hypothetical protein
MMPVPVASRSKTKVHGRSPTASMGSSPTGGMDVCCAGCVLLVRGLCDELITRPEGPTECGTSLCVIKKPRRRGGHSPRWAAEPEKINNNYMMIMTMKVG